MLAYYAEGAIGFVMAIIGVIGIVVGIITIDLTPNEAWYYIIAGTVLAFAGGYLRYLSRQTFRVRDPFVGPHISLLSTYEGQRDLSDAAYRDFLMKKYHVNKKNVLGKYVLHVGLFDDAETAIRLADAIDSHMRPVADSGA
jgi:hypothetical protein